MDILQDMTFFTLSMYREALPYLLPVLQQLHRLQYRFYTQVYPILLPYLNSFYLWAHESPAIISVGALLLFLVIALQIMSFFRRIMMFWVRLMWKVVFWGGLVVLGSAVYQRGFERTARELGGWAAQLAEIWWREYDGYQRTSQPGVRKGGYKVKDRDYGKRNGRSSWR